MVGTDLARAPTAPRAAPTSSALGSTGAPPGRHDAAERRVSHQSAPARRRAGLLRRRAPPGAGGKASSLQRYYTDDVPGLKISPVRRSGRAAVGAAPAAAERR